MRQYAGFASPEDTNERYRYVIEHGSTGLSMAFDLPTQLGRDSDGPLCTGGQDTRSSDAPAPTGQEAAPLLRVLIARPPRSVRTAEGGSGRNRP